MYQENDNFLVIDLETTGLDPLENRIVEVAWATARGDLLNASEIHSRVITPVGAALDHIRGNEVVLEMHTRSGLLAELEQPELTHHLAAVEDEILAHIDREGRWHLAGFSVHFDQDFIRRYMPRLAKRMHHRILDLSSVKLALGSIGVELEVPENQNAHRAANDVQEVLDYIKSFQRFALGREVLQRALDPHLMKGFVR